MADAKVIMDYKIEKMGYSGIYKCEVTMALGLAGVEYERFHKDLARLTFNSYQLQDRNKWLFFCTDNARKKAVEKVLEANLVRFKTQEQTMNYTRLKNGCRVEKLTNNFYKWTITKITSDYTIEELGYFIDEISGFSIDIHEDKNAIIFTCPNNDSNNKIKRLLGVGGEEVNPSNDFISVWVFDDKWKEGYRFDEMITKRYCFIPDIYAKSPGEALDFLRKAFDYIPKIQGTSKPMGKWVQVLDSHVLLIREKMA